MMEVDTTVDNTGHQRSRDYLGVTYCLWQVNRQLQGDLHSDSCLVGCCFFFTVCVFDNQQRVTLLRQRQDIQLCMRLPVEQFVCGLSNHGSRATAVQMAVHYTPHVCSCKYFKNDSFPPKQSKYKGVHYPKTITVNTHPWAPRVSSYFTPNLCRVIKNMAAPH